MPENASHVNTITARSWDEIAANLEKTYMANGISERVARKAAEITSLKIRITVLLEYARWLGIPAAVTDDNAGAVRLDISAFTRTVVVRDTAGEIHETITVPLVREGEFPKGV